MGRSRSLATSVLRKQSPLVYHSSYRWFRSIAFNESLLRNPTQPVYLLESQGHLLLVSAGTRTNNNSHQMRWEVKSYTYRPPWHIFSQKKYKYTPKAIYSLGGNKRVVRDLGVNWKIRHLALVLASEDQIIILLTTAKPSFSYCLAVAASSDFT